MMIKCFQINFKRVGDKKTQDLKRLYDSRLCVVTIMIFSLDICVYLRKVTIYLLTSCNTEERIAQNIYIHNSNRNYKKLTSTTILIKKRIGIGFKNYKKQCPGLEFRLISKLISWAGSKPKKFKNFL